MLLLMLQIPWRVILDVRHQCKAEVRENVAYRTFYRSSYCVWAPGGVANLRHGGILVDDVAVVACISQVSLVGERERERRNRDETSEGIEACFA